MGSTLVSEAFVLNEGNTAWTSTSAAIVLMMTVPGLAFFYGGMVRSKSVLNMLMMNFISVGTVGFIWVLYGYSMAFGPSTTGLGQFFNSPFTYFGLDGLTDDKSLTFATKDPRSSPSASRQRSP